MNNTKNWKDVKNDLENTNEEKSLLLGNGFTIACVNDEEFNQKVLIDKVHKYFKKRDATKDITNIEDYIFEIEKQFIKQLYNSLPEEKINTLLENKIVTPFLCMFDNFYTLNYDHVLYFLLMGLLNNTTKRTTDGFLGNKDEPKIWDKQNSQCVYYLHGAFHIKISSTGSVEKIVRKDNLNLFKTIKEEWDKGTKSHLVIATDYKTKELKLTTNYSPYLTHCFNKFKHANGIMVTFGVSFSESDTHIIDALKNNKNLHKIYIGYFNKHELKNLQEKFKDNNKVEYFCTENIFNFN